MFQKIAILALTLALMSGAAFGAAQQDVEAAAQAGKVAFIMVYDAAATELDAARQMTADAARQIPGAVTVELDRGESANADFVAKYRLSAAPVPLILVSSSTGVIAGGLVATQATVDRLVKLVPSPKKSAIIKALSEGNAVFITASRKTMTKAESVNSACAAACLQMEGKSVQVAVDMDDPAEAGFLTEMKVNLQATEPVTLVANAQGQIAGVYAGTVQVGDLVTAASKKVGGCCPSTVSNPNASCAPNK